MPELPEVETVRRGLEPVMKDARFTLVEQRRPDLRFPFPDQFTQRLQGRTVTALTRRAKYLVADMDGDDLLVMHLGMSGRFLIENGSDDRDGPGHFHAETGGNSAHDHVVFHLSNGARITYNDTRRFGFMLLVPVAERLTHAVFRHVGIEPLGNELGAETLARLFAGKRAPLKAALLDQRLIAGLGNIYVCEALHRSGLSPERAAGSIVMPDGRPTDDARRLATAIRDVLTDAIAAGGSTLRDYAQADGSLGYFQHTFRVYDREGLPCPTPGCSGHVERIVQSGRSTFFCRSCQT
ncbi:bifunctional DNA-formamidopyrimidine glycosylase/DNA-(apurinic or apyrimidinic site) lyase [Pseudochelatococcus contaminans]|uniref:Formamidopyrimidine-DNA glycosylase n=1 Tax=Pseudochelatococcus contaminans TaxID=1538103 RepID=A0A7W5Z4U8_9HYPH|nr:bifunctional DNA-formamidopyrimidine glycosylase/DNA-(apurinic or apyrimidinic site) lyase [Pseudochelatococcus contaminans]MBB3810190.1 formamidopyrimidine-DNA glycosylase [Pseudochelatococcus contaminans]